MELKSHTFPLMNTGPPPLPSAQAMMKTLFPTQTRIGMTSEDPRSSAQMQLYSGAWPMVRAFSYVPLDEVRKLIEQRSQ